MDNKSWCLAICTSINNGGRQASPKAVFSTYYLMPFLKEACSLC